MNDLQIDMTHKLLRRIARALEAQLAEAEKRDCARVDATGNALVPGTDGRKAPEGRD